MAERAQMRVSENSNLQNHEIGKSRAVSQRGFNCVAQVSDFGNVRA